MKSLDYYEGVVDGLTKYAWWKDGIQYVGTCGKTLKSAIEDVEQECAREQKLHNCLHVKNRRLPA